MNSRYEDVIAITSLLDWFGDLPDELHIVAAVLPAAPGIALPAEAHDDETALPPLVPCKAADGGAIFLDRVKQ